MVQGLVDRLKHRPWLALLIDGIGATLSAFSLGVVLPALEPYVGMPRRVLFVLALVALVYAACSIGSYCLRRNEWRPWLRAISRLNLAYCGVTAALVVAFWTRLMFVGVVLLPRASPYRHPCRGRTPRVGSSRPLGRRAASEPREVDYEPRSSQVEPHP